VKPLIRDHVYRPPAGANRHRLLLPCGYWNCRRPVAEHERAVSGWGR
jgi:hypothetical protein